MARLRRVAVGASLALPLLCCARPEVGPAAPTIVLDARTPEIRIGVVTGASAVTVGGGDRVRLSSPDGVEYAELPAGESATLSVAGPGLRVRLGGMVLNPGPALELRSADSVGPVRLNGRDYRGRFVLGAGAAGVSATNLVDVEDYLAGVVGAEMGRRGPEDLAALRAQAVISRTIALKALGRWRLRGYDLLSTVADQAYSGIGFEYPLATQAVAETRGEAVTWDGAPIDGFFHSTCAGRTAPGVEVFAGADRPYLRSIRDEDPGGRAWCAISPRFRWQESWTGEGLARTLAETLPRAGGSAQLARGVLDLRVVDRTATGRVAHLELSGPAGSVQISGPTARLVLRTGDGSILRSASFTVQLTRSGGRITQLLVEGAGAGHGVGMCQWGALGRSRAGASYQEILSAYFPGTEITRTY